MKQNFELNAKTRSAGRGASRRLRREDHLPGIIYGGNLPPQAISINHHDLWHAIEHEAFYSSIITLNIDGATEKAVLKDLQRHPYKAKILHIDFQRIREDQAIHVHVPLHFIGQSPALKLGGVVTHLLNEVEVICLPKDLPEYIEVDLSSLGLDQTIHLSELKLPNSIKIAELVHDNDQGVVNIHIPRAIAAEETAAAPEAAAATPTKSDEKK